jgi:hypothetical protein
MSGEAFKKYKQDLATVTDGLSLGEAIKSDRTGTKGIRDNFVLLKMALQESLSYFSIVQFVIIFTFVPDAIEKLNSFLKAIYLPYQFPVDSLSIVAFLFLCFIFIFGIISYRFFGLARRANEVSALYSPGNLLLYKKLCDIENRLKEEGK